MLAALLGVGVGLGVALASESTIPPLPFVYGGAGGSPAQARCPERSYVAGLRVFHDGTTVAGAALLCRADTDRRRRFEGALFGQRNAREERLECDDGWVAVGIWGAAGGLVDRLSLMCAARKALAGPVRHLRPVGGTGGGGFRAWCPVGQGLTGLFGAAGQLLDRVAPICRAPHD
ncbi:MAG TPA: hypothetical protein VFZ61_34900 [Polyangiales bacterium]